MPAVVRRPATFRLSLIVSGRPHSVPRVSTGAASIARAVASARSRSRGTIALSAGLCRAMRSAWTASNSAAEILRERRLRTISVAERNASATPFAMVLVRECAHMPEGSGRPLGRTLIRGGSLFDGTGTRAHPADLLIETDRIVEIAPSGMFDGRAVASTIDARGMTGLPGLIDAHVHVGREPDHDGRLYLHAGVTSARDTGGVLDNLRALRAR